MPATKNCAEQEAIKSLKNAFACSLDAKVRSSPMLGKNDNQLVLSLVNKVDQRVFLNSIAVFGLMFFVQDEVKHCLARG